MVCQIPLRRMNYSHSELVKTDPLLDTNNSGIVAKVARSCEMVAGEVADFTGRTSIHFE